MRTWIVILFALTMVCCNCNTRAQTYTDSIEQFRQNYIKELLADSRAPLKQSDTRYLRFFAPDVTYKVRAEFTASPGSKPFLIATHSGKQKPFKEYGKLTFYIHDSQQTLHIYQSVDLINNSNHKDDLFIPFNDATNYEATFGGGRYIDMNVAEIIDGHCILDFNKCYNPYCAYAGGYSCPIPPAENHLEIPITAGEKMYAGNINE